MPMTDVSFDEQQYFERVLVLSNGDTGEEYRIYRTLLLPYRALESAIIRQFAEACEVPVPEPGALGASYQLRAICQSTKAKQIADEVLSDYQKRFNNIHDILAEWLIKRKGAKEIILAEIEC